VRSCGLPSLAKARAPQAATVLPHSCCARQGHRWRRRILVPETGQDPWDWRVGHPSPARAAYPMEQRPLASARAALVTSKEGSRTCCLLVLVLGWREMPDWANKAACVRHLQASAFGKGRMACFVLAACGLASVQATELDAGLVACAVHAPALRDTKVWLLTYVIHHVAQDTCTGTCMLV
jgi:hypothetical protein